MSPLYNAKAPLSGRLIFLVSAYSPVFAIAGIRLWNEWVGLVLLVAGLLGSIAWILFLTVLPKRQPRRINGGVCQIEYLDSEVTGYLVSIVLPIIAVNNPSSADWIAYSACAALILTVAFASNLWIANPLTYLMGYQAARCHIDGKPCVVLYNSRDNDRAEMLVVRAAGVILVLGQVESKTGALKK